MASVRRPHALPLIASLAGLVGFAGLACTKRDPADTSASEGSSESGLETSASATVPTTSGDTSTSAPPPTTTGPVTDTTSEPGTTTDVAEPATGTTTTGITGMTSLPGLTDTVGMTDDTAGTGECEVNADCASAACLEFRDLAVDGVCVDDQGDGKTRFPGTVVDFVTGAPLPATEVKIIGALDALLDPVNATPLVAGISDAAGILDITSDEPLAAGIGVVAVVTGDSLMRSMTAAATVMKNGQYGPMSDSHDFWGVPSGTLAAWSAMLMKEPALAEHLPLGSKGGVVGLVRDKSGEPVVGAVVESVTNGGNTQAKLRYLAPDGQSFNSEATASSGVFVLLGPGLAEEFQVVGAPAASEVVGNANDGVFVMTLDLP